MMIEASHPLPYRGDMTELTEILRQIQEGDASSTEKLLPMVYQELRQIAAERLRHEKPGQTLQATALVHEAWLRLVDVDYVQRWENQRHFLAAAAEAMRRILVDKARRKNRRKHGGGWRRVDIESDQIPDSVEDGFLESLDIALEQFEQVDPTACELVKLRYFAGLSLRDAADALEMPARTADRMWAYSKAWLMREIQRETDDST